MCLTYFGQWTEVQSEISPKAMDEMYCAPGEDEQEQFFVMENLVILNLCYQKIINIEIPVFVMHMSANPGVDPNTHKLIRYGNDHLIHL